MTTVEMLGAVFLLAAGVAILGVLFGIFIVAPRITRAVDRAEREDEDPGDRPH